MRRRSASECKRTTRHRPSAHDEVAEARQRLADFLNEGTAVRDSAEPMQWSGRGLLSLWLVRLALACRARFGTFADAAFAVIVLLGSSCVAFVGRKAIWLIFGVGAIAIGTAPIVALPATRQTDDRPADVAAKGLAGSASPSVQPAPTGAVTLPAERPLNVQVSVTDLAGNLLQRVIVPLVIRDGIVGGVLTAASKAGCAVKIVADKVQAFQITSTGTYPFQALTATSKVLTISIAPIGTSDPACQLRLTNNTRPNSQSSVKRTPPSTVSESQTGTTLAPTRGPASSHSRTQDVIPTPPTAQCEAVALGPVLIDLC